MPFTLVGSDKINFKNENGTLDGFIYYDYVNDKLTFNTGNTDRLTIDASNVEASIISATDRIETETLRASTDLTLMYGTTDTLAKFVGGSSAQLYHNNVKKFETDSSGTTTMGTCNINGETGFAVIEMGGDDGAFIDMKAPAGDDHDVRLRTYGDGQFQISGYGGGGTSAETMANFHYNGAVELFHDGTLRLKTAANGINVTPEGSAPANNATGAAGDIALHGDYIYVCTATDTWKRVALSTY